MKMTKDDVKKGLEIFAKMLRILSNENFEKIQVLIEKENMRRVAEYAETTEERSV